MSEFLSERKHNKIRTVGETTQGMKVLWELGRPIRMGQTLDSKAKASSKAWAFLFTPGNIQGVKRMNCGCNPMPLKALAFPPIHCGSQQASYPRG